MNGREGGLDSIYIELNAEFKLKLDPVLTKYSRAHALYPVLTVLLILHAICIHDACVVLRSTTQSSCGKHEISAGGEYGSRTYKQNHIVLLDADGKF